MGRIMPAAVLAVAFVSCAGRDGRACIVLKTVDGMGKRAQRGVSSSGFHRDPRVSVGEAAPPQAVLHLRPSHYPWGMQEPRFLQGRPQKTASLFPVSSPWPHCFCRAGFFRGHPTSPQGHNAFLPLPFTLHWLLFSALLPDTFNLLEVP